MTTICVQEIEIKAKQVHGTEQNVVFVIAFSFFFVHFQYFLNTIPFATIGSLVTYKF